jgi:hypothetical protein
MVHIAERQKQTMWKSDPVQCSMIMPKPQGFSQPSRLKTVGAK